MDAGGDEVIAGELGDDASGFVLEMVVLTVCAAEKCGAELDPMDEVFGGGDADGVGDAVPLGVGEDVASIRALDDARVFDSTGPLAGLLGVGRGIEDGLGSRVKVTPSVLEARPSREVWAPICISPVSSSAR